MEASNEINIETKRKGTLKYCGCYYVLYLVGNLTDMLGKGGTFVRLCMWPPTEQLLNQLTFSCITTRICRLDDRQKKEVQTAEK